MEAMKKVQKTTERHTRTHTHTHTHTAKQREKEPATGTRQMGNTKRGTKTTQRTGRKKR